MICIAFSNVIYTKLLNNYENKTLPKKEYLNIFVKELKKNNIAQGTITYFGGEPTLMWDSIIVPLTIYVKETYGDLIKFNMTTNGTLLNEERINFMKEYEIYPHLSIDGNKETQDKNRPLRNGESNFDKVIKNIPLLLEYFPNTTFRATVTPDSCENLFENYLFALSQGFRSAFFAVNEREPWSEDKLEILRQEINKISLHRLMCFSEGIYPISMTQWDDGFREIEQCGIKILQGLDNVKPLESRNTIRCGLGTVSVSVGYDGKLYGCQEQTSKGTDSLFYIGDIYNGINKELHNRLLQEYSKVDEDVCENKEECNNCAIKSICVAMTCPSTAKDVYDNFFINSKVRCLVRNWIIDGSVTALSYMEKTKKDKVFKKYLNNILVYVKQEVA